MNTLTADEKRVLLQRVIDGYIVNDIDCGIDICSICNKIMIFDDGDMESGNCEDCQDAICGECGGLQMIGGEAIKEEAEIEAEDGVIVTLDIQFDSAKFLCPGCANVHA